MSATDLIRSVAAALLIAATPALAQDAPTPATQEALDLEQQANVVLYFAGAQSPTEGNAGTFYIAKPDPSPDAVGPDGRLSIGRLKPLPMPDLGSFLKDVSGEKTLAVVVLNKTAQHWPEHVLMRATDAMTADFKSAGFPRVVFVFDMGAQRKIYYDAS